MENSKIIASLPIIIHYHSPLNITIFNPYNKTVIVVSVTIITWSNMHCYTVYEAIPPFSKKSLLFNVPNDKVISVLVVLKCGDSMLTRDLTPTP